MDSDRGKKKRRYSNARWVARIFIITLVISVTLEFASTKALEGVGYIISIAVLALFIIVNIFFDVIGVAVTAADERPFHAMASRRVAGSRDALWLIKNADRVSSMCNDVIGDISGIISGSTGAAVAVMLISDFGVQALTAGMIITGAVSALTVGGKALGKTVALKYSTEIVHLVGRILSLLKRIFLRSKKK